MSEQKDGHVKESRPPDKRRIMITQLLRSPVLNPAGAEVGRVQDVVVKLAEGGYPPVTGLKVRVGAQDVFVGKELIDRRGAGRVWSDPPTTPHTGSLLR